jgi:serine protease inhibitor
MKKLALFLMIVLFPVIACDEKEEVRLGPKEIKLSAAQKELIEGSNRFGLKLFHQILSAEEPGENVFISPLSVHLALSMAWNGADADTRDQMMEVLGFPDISDEEINKAISKLIADLLSVDEKVETGIANSIWYRDGFSVKPGFLDVNREYFNAMVSSLDFDDPGSRDIINAWVAEQTRERIMEIIDRIDPDHVMFLINAIYFKGIWSTEFVKENTREREFHLHDGSAAQVMTMETEGEFAYARRDGYRVAELPYGRGNYSMLVFLPDEETGVDGMLDLLTPEEWNLLPETLNRQTVNVRLPKFTFEYENELNISLQTLGMTDAFMPYGANFDRLAELPPGLNIYISRVKHKSFVEVNEEGTEAAAVTSVEIRVTSVGPDVPEVTWFHVDRPFMIAIREKYTNSIIFIGRITAPSSD